MLADLVAAGGDGDPAAIAAAKGSRRWSSAPWRPPSTTPSPPMPAAWEKYVGGDDKAVGALVGAVMKATKGKADGKAVTALLRARRDAAPLSGVERSE